MGEREKEKRENGSINGNLPPPTKGRGGAVLIVQRCRRGDVLGDIRIPVCCGVLVTIYASPFMPETGETEPSTADHMYRKRRRADRYRFQSNGVMLLGGDLFSSSCSQFRNLPIRSTT